MARPYGLILISGPTGSGKSTTLYSMLKEINDESKNVLSLEDPVEYNMEGVSQSQVRPEIGYTFASGLRTTLRQDPDIIMVGEIRDDETAGIAVNAAMTGHLLLSTLHSNDAGTTFPRLADMGIEPFLIASSVNVVVAQRLARKVCHKCKTNYFLSPDEVNMVNAEPTLASAIKKLSGKDDLHTVRFYRGAGNGCDVCNDTGYNGRLGIFEVMEVTDGLRALIAKKSPADEITRHAVSEGMRTMFEDGILKMLKGMTTLEEVVRAIKS
jgi:type II secretory ATPase GspE/PulE/Tfp pilus assembly ATPase PilB-like protein